jgi:large subunit ribosomal protein L15
MDLSNLKPAKGSVGKKKRIARGVGSGKGRTAGKGTKGAQSRSGYTYRAWFEGGQMPLQRRVPKRGFKNINRVEYAVFNLSRIQEMIDAKKLKSFDLETLVSEKVVSKNDKVKVLGHGELKSKIDVTVHAISESAKKAIEAAGGTVNLV